MNDHAAVEHALVHVRDALATDGRVGELGLDVRMEPSARGASVTVRGAVSTDARRAAIVDLVAEVLRDHGVDLPVVDATEVPCADEPAGEPERL